MKIKTNHLTFELDADETKAVKETERIFYAMREALAENDVDDFVVVDDDTHYESEICSSIRINDTLDFLESII